MHRESYRSYCIYGVRAFADKALTTLRFFQTHYANHHRTAEGPLKTGDLVYLVTKNLNLSKGHADKLLLIYIISRLLTHLYRIIRSIF